MVSYRRLRLHRAGDRALRRHDGAELGARRHEEAEPARRRELVELEVVWCWRREEGGEEKYRAARSEQGLNNWSYPPVAVLVPCYLPNERQIIVETIEQIVHNLKYPADVRVCLVYNTPHDMPADEKALVALQNRKWPAGRSVVVYKAQTSRSKAENLNLAIRNLVQEELVAIYDADHWPDAYALMLLVEIVHVGPETCTRPPS